MQLKLKERIKKLNPFKKKAVEEPVKDWHEKTPPPPKKKRKIQIPGLRKAKRIFGGFLLIMNLGLAMFSINMINAFMTFFFFSNTFIFFDYLWKTRKQPDLEDWMR